MIFAVGLLCIFFEFNHPGAILPGVVGFIAVSISLYTLQLLPLRSMAVVMIHRVLCNVRAGSQVSDPWHCWALAESC